MWTNVKAGVSQGSILGPLLFFIYINDLVNGLSSNTNPFADDTSLFSNIHDSVITTSELHSDLARIQQWAFQWKMTFNPDLNKQAQKVVFSRKLKKVCHPPLRFKNNVSQTSSQKHLGLTLDNRLTFDKYFTNLSNKTSKTIGLLQRLQNKPALLTIYKCFLRPHLNYGDIIYDQVYNLSFHQKLVLIQYNAALTLTKVAQGESCIKSLFNCDYGMGNYAVFIKFIINKLLVT